MCNKDNCQITCHEIAYFAALVDNSWRLKDRTWTLSWARYIRSILVTLFFRDIHFNSFLQSLSRSFKWSIPLSISATYWFAFHFCMRATSPNSSLLCWSSVCLVKCANCEARHYAVFFSLLQLPSLKVRIFKPTPSSQSPPVYVLRSNTRTTLHC